MSSRLENEDYVRMNRRRIHDYDSVNSNNQYYGSARNRSITYRATSALGQNLKPRKSNILIIIIIMILILNLLIFTELTFFGFIVYNKLTSLKVKIINNNPEIQESSDTNLNIMKSKIDHILNAVSFRIPQDMREFIKEYTDTMITGKIIDIIKSSKSGLNLDLKVDDTKGLLFRIGSVTSSSDDIDNLYRFFMNHTLSIKPTSSTVEKTTRRINYALPKGPPGLPVSSALSGNKETPNKIKLNVQKTDIPSDLQFKNENKSKIKDENKKPKDKNKKLRDTTKVSKKSTSSNINGTIGTLTISYRNIQNYKSDIYVRNSRGQYLRLDDFKEILRSDDYMSEFLNDTILRGNWTGNKSNESSIGFNKNKGRDKSKSKYLLLDNIPIKGNRKAKRIKHYKFCANYLKGRQRIIKALLQWIRILDNNLSCGKYNKLVHIIKN